MRFFFTSIILALLVCFPLYGETKTIVFLGDSLTAGYGLAEEESYPLHIQKLIESDGLSWNVVNAGISGDTTQGGIKRLSWILKSRPSIVFVALGANDGLRGFEVKYTKNNLETIISTLKKAGVKVILAGIDLPTNYGESYRKEFKDIYPSLAKKHKIVLFPFLLEGVAARAELNLADGIHPNAKGQEIIAKNVYKFLKPYLRSENEPQVGKN